MIVPLVDNLDSIEREREGESFCSSKQEEEHVCHSDWQRYLHNHLSLSVSLVGAMLIGILVLESCWQRAKSIRDLLVRCSALEQLIHFCLIFCCCCYCVLRVKNDGITCPSVIVLESASERERERK